MDETREEQFPNSDDRGDLVGEAVVDDQADERSTADFEAEHFALPEATGVVSQKPLAWGVAASLAAVVCAGGALAYGAATGLHSPLFSSADVLLPAVSWGLTAYFFSVGAVIGSFLNVVAYRTPLGASLLHPPSSCPRCGERIWARDNVPIAGWLLLRGRCRNCRGAISSRYPTVELLVGTSFATLAATGLFSGAAGPPWNATTAPSTAVLEWRTDQALVYLLHAWLAGLLAVDAAMRFDGNASPARWASYAFAGSATCILIDPAVHPFHWTAPIESQASETMRALAAATISAAAGWCGGAVVNRMAPQLGRRRRDYRPAFCTAGAILGLGAAALVFAATGVVLAAVGVLRLRRRSRRLATATAPAAIALAVMLLQLPLYDFAAAIATYLRSTLQ